MADEAEARPVLTVVEAGGTTTRTTSGPLTATGTTRTTATITRGFVS